MTLVLDSAAFLSGRLTKLPHGRVVTTPEIVGEVRKGNPSRLLDNLIAAGLEVIAPIDGTAALEAANRTNDIAALSKADLSVIALSLEVESPMVVTDDFRVQNVLMTLGVPFQDAGEIGDRRVREIRTYTFRCKGCGRFYDREMLDCPICGSVVRRVMSRG